MVTLNSELQNFYDNMNGKISTLDAKAGNLVESMTELQKFNSQFSDSVAYHYQGKVQKNTLQNLSSINSTISTITSSINDKIYTSITTSKELLDSINELIELKNKINNGGAVHTEAG